MPCRDGEFDFTLMVTTVCFLDDIDLAFREVHRILKPGGSFIVGFVDRESPLGQGYLNHKNRSTFYREATFYSVSELEQHLTAAGFGKFTVRQTLSKTLDAMTDVDPVQEGHGRGSFIVIRGIKN